MFDCLKRNHNAKTSVSAAFLSNMYIDRPACHVHTAAVLFTVLTEANLTPRLNIGFGIVDKGSVYFAPPVQTALRLIRLNRHLE